MFVKPYIRDYQPKLTKFVDWVWKQPTIVTVCNGQFVL
jgi:hypothetical protein